MAEYALALAVATAALAGMSTYVRRALQARVKATTDAILALNDSDLNGGRATRGDFNGDGKVSWAENIAMQQLLELPNALSHGRPNLSPDQLSAADINGDGQVDFADFFCFAMWNMGTTTPPGVNHSTTLNPQAIDSILQGCPAQPPAGKGDLDGDGEVGLGDEILLAAYLRAHFKSLTPQEQSVVDVNGDGRIDVADYLYETWLAYLTSGVPVAASSMTVPDWLAQLEAAGKGDLNGDGKVTAEDADIFLAYLRDGAPLSADQLARASDIACSGGAGPCTGIPKWSDYSYVLQMALSNLQGQPIPGLSSPVTGQELQRLGIQYEQPYAAIPGDIDGDGHVTVADVVAMNHVLTGSGTPQELEAADVNGDGKIDQSDLQALVALAISPQDAAPAPSKFTTTSSSRHSEIGIVQNGDLNGDGQVTVDEILNVNACRMGPCTLTPEQRTIADVNGNGSIDGGDVSQMMEFALHGINNAGLARHIEVEEDETTSRSGHSLTRSQQQIPAQFNPRWPSPNNSTTGSK